MKLFLFTALFGAVLAEPISSLTFRPLTQAEAVARVRAIKKGGESGALAHREAVPDEDTAVALAVAIWRSSFPRGTDWKESDFRAYRADECWLVRKRRSEVGAPFEAVIVAADARFVTV